MAAKGELRTLHFSLLVRIFCHLFLGSFVCFDLVILMHGFHSSKNTWVVVKEVGINVIPKSRSDARNHFCNKQISKGRGCSSDQGTAIALNNSFNPFPILGHCTGLEFLTKFLEFFWIFALERGDKFSLKL